jgi:hypothetical protein
MTTLTQAHNEWSKRAPDERFASLGAMYSAAVEAHENSAQADISTKDLTVDYSADGDIYLVGTSGKRANMTNWSMGQLARRVGVPNNYLANISDNPDLVAKNLNYGLQRVPADEAPTCNMLFRTGRASGLQLRSLTSELYSRIWNSDVISSLIRLEAEGPWQPAPAAFDGSRGLYMGDNAGRPIPGLLGELIMDMSPACTAPRQPPISEKDRDWMQGSQAGARKCPAGVFPHNFYFWIEGGRW